MVLQEGAEAFLSRTVPIATFPSPPGRSTAEVVKRAANPNGAVGILRTVSDSAALTDNACRHVPVILRELAADALVADQMEPAAGLIARHLGLPFVSIACAVPLERDERIPPPYLDWPYANDEAGIKRNRGGETVARLLLRAQRATIRRWAEQFGHPGLQSLEDCLSPLGTIAQLPSALDFPRAPTDRPLVQVGPVRDPPSPTPLSIDIEPERPFVFMSLGTLQGHRYSVFKAVARACSRMGAQLMVAHCGGLTPRRAERLGATWVTDFVPQREILAKADVCVTHGGQNTVLDALEAGKPMLVLPIAFDQPGLAARIVHHGVGIKLSPRFLSVERVGTALETLLQDPSYAERSRTIRDAIASSGGIAAAVETVERLLTAVERDETAMISAKNASG